MIKRLILTASLIIFSFVFVFVANAEAETTDLPQTIKAYRVDIEGREYLQEGYINQQVWQDEFNSQLEQAEYLNSELSQLEEFLDDESIARINDFNTNNFTYIEEVNDYIANAEQMKKEALAAKERQLEQQRQKRNAQEQNYNSNASNFKSQGVIYQNGIRYTYYSSNVLYHYRTPEWTVGADGIYRDSSGYIVVASSDYGQGTIVSTPFGQGRVYDSGCASRTIDIYTNF